eukprot:TRINITY_DN5408_c0_g2_i1.p1 TRINITY_DN5408_c0_g2~~TRINITY_DN5408_c0_g2_i1.p1  ORF type:complete len:290 (-),score=56.24 TRINITY_DN5408_c0_g2_i1:80-949(-)
MVKIEEISASEAHQCAYCSDPGSSKWCSLCREVAYCSKGCQQAHWKIHRRSCSKRFEASPKEPARVENPCVRCGKKGVLKSSEKWYCSHDCCGRDLTDLTSNISKLANHGYASAEVKEANRIKDFISAHSTSAQKSKAEKQCPNESGKLADDKCESAEAKEVNRIKDFITTQSAPTQKKKSKAEKQLKSAHETANKEQQKLKDLIQSCSEPAEAAKLKTEKDSLYENLKKLANNSQTESAPAELEEARSKVEAQKAKEHERFTQWVQWAQGEIQKKREEAESDDDLCTA